MSERECVYCGGRLDGHDFACSSCGASWPGIAILDRPPEDRHADEAIVWVLGAMITLVGFFLIFVAW